MEKARTALLPLAWQLEADYDDPALGFSFSSPERPVGGKRYRADDSSIEVGLFALYDGHKHPHRSRLCDSAGAQEQSGFSKCVLHARRQA